MAGDRFFGKLLGGGKKKEGVQTSKVISVSEKLLSEDLAKLKEYIKGIQIPADDKENIKGNLADIEVVLGMPTDKLKAIVSTWEEWAKDPKSVLHEQGTSYLALLNAIMVGASKPKEEVKTVKSDGTPKPLVEEKTKTEKIKPILESIIGKQYDLKGDERLPPLCTYKEIMTSKLLKDGKEVSDKEKIKLYLELVKGGLDEGYINFIKEGRISATDAKTIIESAGFAVPENIIALANEESKLKPEEERENTAEISPETEALIGLLGKENVKQSMNALKETIESIEIERNKCLSEIKYEDDVLGIYFENYYVKTRDGSYLYGKTKDEVIKKVNEKYESELVALGEEKKPEEKETREKSKSETLAPVQELKKISFYAPKPEKDGSFKAGAISLGEDKSNVLKFQNIQNETTKVLGQLILNSEVLALAKKDPDTYIKSLYNIAPDSVPPNKMKKIVILRHAIYKRNGDEWVVDQKGEVRLE